MKSHSEGEDVQQVIEHLRYIAEGHEPWSAKILERAADLLAQQAAELRAEKAKREDAEAKLAHLRALVSGRYIPFGHSEGQR